MNSSRRIKVADVIFMLPRNCSTAPAPPERGLPEGSISVLHEDHPLLLAFPLGGVARAADVLAVLEKDLDESKVGAHVVEWHGAHGGRTDGGVELALDQASMADGRCVTVIVFSPDGGEAVVAISEAANHGDSRRLSKFVATAIPAIRREGDAERGPFGRA